jgi:hypothetical protein
MEENHMRKLSVSIMIVLLSLALLLSGCQTAGTTQGSTGSSTSNPSGNNLSALLNIKFIAVSRPDSNKMVSIKISVGNLSPKKIETITFEIEPLNAAGEPVADERTGFSTQQCKLSGEIDVNQEVNDAVWKDVWQNGDITTVRLVGIAVDFADKDSFIFTESMIASMNVPIQNY